MLYPSNWQYMEDIMSYVAIGARSVENQQHRLTVSGMEVPTGMKNPTSGDLSVMINSVIAGQGCHNFIYNGWEVETDGNPLCHTILRGAVDKYGKSMSNYHYEDLMRVIELYQAHNLKNPACIVDANHSNSGKKWEQQPRIVKEVLHSRHLSPEIRSLVKGVMIESYIEDGRQEIGQECYGKSITDPCLGWDKSQTLLYEIAERV
jgi:3-deoxy-7-phosphoheptulonate synthase